jgi:gamma-glutamylcyclotransferase
MLVQYYFAYGSNIDKIQMKHRCPFSYRIGVATLKDYKVFTSHKSKSWKGGVFSIKEEIGSEVKGLLWEITPEDLVSLDHYEGYPSVYDRRELEVVLENGVKRQAIVYISNRIENVEVSEIYLNHCEEAAKNEGFSINL